MKQAEFFDWAEAQDEHYEFDGVQPVAMTGRSVNHGRITGNILVEIHERLGENSPSETLANAGIQTVGDAVRYPDVLVACALFDGRNRVIPDPIIVFEVVTPSSILADHIIKPQEYAAVASIKRYVIVEQSTVGLTVLWRTDDEPWHFQTLKSGDTLHLPEIGVELPIDSFYARVTFTPEAAPP